jgi:hypothetical protein
MPGSTHRRRGALRDDETDRPLVGFRQCLPQLPAGDDAELREHLAYAPLDGARLRKSSALISEFVRPSRAWTVICASCAVRA